MEADVEQRINGMDECELEELSATLNENRSLLKAALRKGDIKPIEPVLDMFLQLLGIEVADRDEPSYRRFAYQFLEAASKTNDFLQRRNLGEVILWINQSSSCVSLLPAVRLA